MKHSLLILSLAITFTGAAARKGGGGSPSGGGYSKPSGSAPSPSSPSSPAYSPSRPTTVYSGNTNPSFKPVSPTGAPTLKSGGGGYSTTAKVVAAGTTGAAIGISAGTFLYGGRHSSPSCRGTYRYSSSYCPRGRSTTKHTCNEQIPLCPIPETVRERWYVGSYPYVEVVSDASTCTLKADQGFLAVDSGSNSSSEQLALDDCLEQVILEGSCETSRFTFDEESGKCGCCAAGADSTPLPANNDTRRFASAVYSFSFSSPFEEHGPPTHCVSGATLNWPEKSESSDGGGGGDGNATANSAGYVDRTVDCECGMCTSCGSPRTSYFDWSGAYPVPPALLADEFEVVISSDASAELTYDPVDTCICNTDGESCYFSGATATTLPGSSAVLVVIVASALGFGRLP